MKIFFKIILSALLSYAMFMLIVDGGYSFLSLSTHLSAKTLFIEKGIPYLVGFFSSLYTLFMIWKK